MKFVTMPVAFLALLFTSCASDRQFYSIHARDFVPLGGVPVQTELAGRWQSVRSETLVLGEQGKFSVGRTAGCWDADEKHIYFRFGCINYGHTDGYAFLPLAESSERCGFALSSRLSLSGCQFAGEYSRESERR